MGQHVSRADAETPVQMVKPEKPKEELYMGRLQGYAEGFSTTYGESEDEHIWVLQNSKGKDSRRAVCLN